jgi:serine/threonine protein kinase
MLDHPNISRVIDYLPDEGAVVVAYIDGIDGSQMLKESGALPEELMLRVAKALSSAVAYAHQKNIAHRDLKPGNVMFAKNDNIYLIDFGIAKEIGSQATKTAYQALTPMFAAPERQDGEADYNPFLSDIYETGVTLYNFATNDLPYRNPANPNPKEWGGASADNLSPEFRRILKKATHPLPDMRYEDSAELANDLAKLKTAYGGDDIKKPKKKKGGKILMIAAILIVIIAVAGYIKKDLVLEYYNQMTAGRGAPDQAAQEEPSLESVIDSIVGADETVDSLGEMSDASELAVSDESLQEDVKTQDDAGKPEDQKPVVREETESTKIVQKKEPPKTSEPEVAVKEEVVPEVEKVVEETKNPLTVNVTPNDIYKLMVGNIEASKDSTFMLKFGNYNIAVYHPDYPILRNTVYMPKASRTVAYNLEEEYVSTASADLQIALLPLSNDHVVELAFNGKRNTLLEFPVFDFKKPKGRWLVEASIYAVGGGGQGVPQIDSLVSIVDSESSQSKISGDHGEISLGSTGYQDETVKFFIYWSEK